jgi:hypothetical protein
MVRTVRMEAAMEKLADDRFGSFSTVLTTWPNVRSFGPLAPTEPTSREVGLVPIGDIAPTSLDHLVGGHKQRGGQGETKRLRRL